MQTIRTPVLEIAYLEAGPRDGKPVVLLHGYGETGDMWAPLAQDLIRDHTIVVPDLRGHPVDMEMLVVFAVLLLAGVVSVLGPDSRDYNDRDRRGWWPGKR